MGLWVGPPPPCGDTWLCQVMIAIKEIAKAPTCTAKEKRSRLITDRSDRPWAPFTKVCNQSRASGQSAYAQ